MCPMWCGWVAGPWRSRVGDLMSAVEHLRIRMAALHEALRAAVERQARIAAQLTRPDLVPYCVTDEQVSVLLEQVDAFTAAMTAPNVVVEREVEAERELRRAVSAQGETL